MSFDLNTAGWEVILRVWAAGSYTTMGHKNKVRSRVRLDREYQHERNPF